MFIKGYLCRDGQKNERLMTNNGMVTLGNQGAMSMILKRTHIDQRNRDGSSVRNILLMIVGRRGGVLQKGGEKPWRSGVCNQDR